MHRVQRSLPRRSPEEVTWEWYAGTMELLTEAQITAELADVPAWTRDGN